MKICECDDWKENVDVIDAALFLAHNHGSTDIIKVFEFCPWCGNKLADVEKDD